MKQRADLSFILALIIVGALAAVAAGQSRAPLQRAKKGSICGNPKVACKTSVDFHEYDLPFRVPANSAIFDTELFYAIVLKSLPAAEDDYNIFVPETERLEAQLLFPDRKVFTSRNSEPGEMFYTNVDPKFRIMAVYGGTTPAEAKGVLDAVKKDRKIPRRLYATNAHRLQWNLSRADIPVCPL